MTIPGFSAETSLLISNQRYSVLNIISSKNLQIIPQMPIQCLVSSLLLYQECLGTVNTGGCSNDFNNRMNRCLGQP
jgi:hypothetical protein